MSDSQSRIRKMLRKAEEVFRHPAAENALEEDGIHVGPAEEIAPRDLLVALESEDIEKGPSLFVTIFATEEKVTSLRTIIEDRLCEYVIQAGIGTWTGGGQGSIGDQSFFDISFAVTDLESAIALIRQKVTELRSDHRAEITDSDGRIYPVP